MRKSLNEFDNFKEYKTEVRHKEIDLIQSVINRLSDNQIKVKGICISMLAFFAWILRTNHFPIENLGAALIASIITIIVCYRLDFNFLKTERLYRMWFEFIQDRRSETKAWLYELNPSNIVKILKDQVYIPDQFNPDLIKRNLYKNWSLQFYLFLAFVVFIIYLPACFAAFSIQ